MVLNPSLSYMRVAKVVFGFGFLRLILLVLIGTFFSCTSSSIPQEVVLEIEGLPEELDYNFHVKPILSDKCFGCHGPDAANRKAEFRLDTHQGALKTLQAEETRRGIVPGSIENSEVLTRIFHVNEALVMPPVSSHLSLTDREKAIITKWIKDGAEYKRHWSLIPLAPVEIPNESKNLTNPIDQFVLQQLRSKGLDFNEKASPSTLLRRASFSLTGLPPSLPDIKAFVSNKSSTAYSKLIDDLLSRPSYGERMAADWMDVARYADSDGYLDDKHREFSPWRDWVIGAFNKNLSYEEFVTLQLAGDLLPEATKETILPTAFNRLHKRNSEAGIIFEEFRVEHNADRTNTLGKAFLGLSVECARCHDHKYDPISQKDYYSIYAFFNQTNDLGTAVYGPDQTPGPALLLTSEEEEDRLRAIRSYIDSLEKSHVPRKSNFKVSKVQVQQALEKKIVAHYDFNHVSGGQTPESKHRVGAATLKGEILKPGVNGTAFFVSDYNSGKLAKKVGWYDRTDPFSVELWIKPDTLYTEASILAHCENLRLGFKGYHISLDHNRVRFSMSHSWPQNALQVTTHQKITIGEWVHLVITYDGSSKANGVAIYINGDRQDLKTDLDHLYKGILYVPDIHTYGFDGITIGSREKFVPFKNGGLDEIKVYRDRLSALEVWYAYQSTKGSATLDLPAELKEGFVDQNLNEHLKKKRNRLNRAREQENDLVNEIEEIMVMGDLPEGRKTYLLERGVYNAPGEEVSPSTPSEILPFEDKYPKNRLGLAQWLFDPKNPLTARVYVNRIWQMHFGRGLVKTAEDFGNQGDLPSHPELLDWLANYFVESGWDIKALHKLILTSKTYQQSSKCAPGLRERDPENVFLARGPSYRLPAEMIRDNALATSGLLVNKVGGKSVYPYQPEGLWDGLTTKGWAYKYLIEPGEGLYRRSLYTIWKRTSAPPSMQIFDVSDRSTCEVRRTVSSTPLQALVLLNDPQFIEAARVMAENILSKHSSQSTSLNDAFMLTTGREAEGKEFDQINRFYEQELEHFKNNRKECLEYLEVGYQKLKVGQSLPELAALAVVINSLMNTSEAYTMY